MQVSGKQRKGEGNIFLCKADISDLNKFDYKEE